MRPKAKWAIESEPIWARGILLLNILSKQNMKICYYETLKTVNTKNIYGMLLYCKEKANKEREIYTANRNGNQFVVLRFACMS